MGDNGFMSIFPDTSYKPKASTIYFVKEMSIKNKRKKWREEEIERRKSIFSHRND